VPRADQAVAAAHALGERAAGMRTGRAQRVHVLAVADEQHGLSLDLDRPHLPGLERVEGGDVVLMLRHGKLRPVWGSTCARCLRSDGPTEHTAADEVSAGLEHLGIQFPHRAVVGRMILPTHRPAGWRIGLLPLA
jgi:hypothetical protein